MLIFKYKINDKRYERQETIPKNHEAKERSSVTNDPLPASASSIRSIE
jgi:hypothetical protein